MQKIEVSSSLKKTVNAKLFSCDILIKEIVLVEKQPVLESYKKEIDNSQKVLKEYRFSCNKYFFW